MIKLLTRVLFCLLMMNVVNLQAGWRGDHERGWHWYEQNDEEEEIKKEHKVLPQVPPSYASKLKGIVSRVKSYVQRRSWKVRQRM